MKKRNQLIILVVVMLVPVLISIKSDIISRKKLDMLESDSIKVIELSNNKESHVDYSELFGSNRSEMFFKKHQLGLKLNEWRKDYTLVFYKEGKKQVKVSIYTIDKENETSKGMSRSYPTGKNLSYYSIGDRYAVAKLDVGILWIGEHKYTTFNQDFFDNLELLK